MLTPGQSKCEGDTQVLDLSNKRDRDRRHFELLIIHMDLTLAPGYPQFGRLLYIKYCILEIRPRNNICNSYFSWQTTACREDRCVMLVDIIHHGVICKKEAGAIHRLRQIPQEEDKQQRV